MNQNIKLSIIWGSVIVIAVGIIGYSVYKIQNIQNKCEMTRTTASIPSGTQSNNGTQVHFIASGNCTDEMAKDATIN